MTPAQLRAFSAVVRLGSVHAAAAELGMSDAGISMHVAQLRKELDDPLFARTAAGLAFTPGGLRLASRAVEILGLQQQTAIEVTEAAHGRRLLRIAASSAFAEHAAPGLIELFSSRADDLSVELSRSPDEPVPRPDQFARRRRRARSQCGRRIVGRVDLRAALPEVSDHDCRRTRRPARRPAPRRPRCCANSSWMLGPSAGNADGEIATILSESGDSGVAAADLPERRRRAGGGAAGRRCHAGASASPSPRIWRPAEWYT